MKNDMMYQITEYDCAPICLINALNFFYNREDIPINVLKMIWNNTLDLEYGTLGTSNESLIYIAKMLNDNIKIKVEIKEKDNVNLRNIKKTINNKGCVILKTYLQGEHYILITKIDKNFVYAFDPYKLSNLYYLHSKVKMSKQEKTYNSKIPLETFLSNKECDYALGPKDNRFALLFNKS